MKNEHEHILKELKDLGIQLPSNDNVYEEAPNYLEQFTINLMPHCKLDNLDLNDKDPYVTPANYLENFKISIKTKSKTFRISYSNIAIAASLVILLGTSIFYYFKPSIANDTIINFATLEPENLEDVESYIQNNTLELEIPLISDLEKELESIDENSIQQYITEENLFTIDS